MKMIVNSSNKRECIMSDFEFCIILILFSVVKGKRHNCRVFFLFDFYLSI